MTVKLKAPAGVTGFGRGGAEYHVKDGWVDVPDALVPVFEREHGCKRMESVVTSMLNQIDTEKDDSAPPLLTAENVADMDRRAVYAYCAKYDLDGSGRLADVKKAILQHSQEANAPKKGDKDKGAAA